VSTFVFSVLPGIVVGSIVWYYLMRPYQLREHERKRRRLGLPPGRKLPEDDE
jgi:preprotein translocase subunit YajC